jgi:hypothetical protein
VTSNFELQVQLEVLATMESARQVLKDVFGFPSFRLSQEAVSAL